MNEVILTDEDLNLMYDAIDNMSQDALDSWTKCIFGVEIVKDNKDEQLFKG